MTTRITQANNLVFYYDILGVTFNIYGVKGFISELQ